MKYTVHIIWFSMALLAGCASGARPPTAAVPDPNQAAQEAYRQGVDDAVHKFRAMLQERNVPAGILPYAPIFRPPRIERVWVPATVEDGVFIPAHWEWVTIQDGYWEIEGQRVSPPGAHAPGADVKSEPAGASPGKVQINIGGTGGQ